MLSWIRKIIPDRNPIRLFWHKFFAVFAAIFYNFPARKIKVVFVTGTKGKTTTAWVLGSLLQESEIKTAVATTALFRMKNKVWANETKMTTLGRLKLQSFIKKAVKEKCEVVVIETSSQASTQSRLWGIPAVGFVWTNLQEDHLEYHGGWDNYKEAKGELIKNVNKNGFVILNADDAEVGFFIKKAKGLDVNLVGTKPAVVSKKITKWKIGSQKFSAQGLSFSLGKEKNFKANFTGKFNVQNIAEAMVAAHKMGVSLSKLKKALAKVSPVPGRLEEVKNKKGLQIFIDFAYTPAALENALSAVRERMNKKGKLWVVFGAVAGGRDVRKRSVMGAVADKMADRIVLTDDDLGPDDVSEEVIEGIVSGFSGKMKKAENKNWWRVTPREKAVDLALKKAKRGDSVLFAGKGCETVQHYGSRQKKYSERKVVEKALKK